MNYGWNTKNGQPVLLEGGHAPESKSLSPRNASSSAAITGRRGSGSNGSNPNDAKLGPSPPRTPKNRSPITPSAGITATTTGGSGGARGNSSRRTTPRSSTTPIKNSLLTPLPPHQQPHQSSPLSTKKEYSPSNGQWLAVEVTAPPELTLSPSSPSPITGGNQSPLQGLVPFTTPTTVHAVPVTERAYHFTDGVEAEYLFRRGLSASSRPLTSINNTVNDDRESATNTSIINNGDALHEDNGVIKLQLDVADGGGVQLSLSDYESSEAPLLADMVIDVVSLCTPYISITCW
jgi:hypothetical protein